MDSPQTHIWGPHLWTLLHSSAEKIGSQPIKRLPAEATRIWIGLLSSLRYSLPCPVCKKHFTDYYSSHPIHNLNKDTITSWLFTLHCQVNERTGKPNTITIEQLTELYNKPINFTAHLNVLYEQMTKAIRIGWSARDDVQRTVRFLQELRRFYDFF